MPISFVYYFHSMRTDNLKQTLRLLFQREKCIGEVILVCNDRTEEVFENCRLYNMALAYYEKPKMCNFGVSKASCEVVALMDSDRVLPPGYFESILDRIKPGQMFSCDKLLTLDKPYSDEEINKGNFSYYVEMKSRTWEIRKKNLFSGNTTFMKEDYLSCGGMDEQFIGYGFADNDMTINVVSKGIEAVWGDEDELHLYHEKNTMENNQILVFPDFAPTSQSNLMKFLRKWKINHEEHKRKLFL